MTEQKKVIGNGITIQEAMEALNVSESTIRRYIEKGTIRGRKIGGTTYVAESDVEGLKEDF